MEERRCEVKSMVEASDCRGGVAVSICSLDAVAGNDHWFIIIIIIRTENLQKLTQSQNCACNFLSPYKCMCCLRHVKRTCGSSSMRSRAFGCGQTSPEPLWGWTYLAATPNQNPDPEKTTGGKEKRWFTYMSNASDQIYVILSFRCHHTKPGKADLIQNSKLEQYLTGASLHGFHFRGPINRKKTKAIFHTGQSFKPSQRQSIWWK